MSETPFQTFIDLITFDQTILATEKSIAALKQEILDLKKEEQVKKEIVDNIKARSVKARKSVDSVELEIKDLDASERAKKERLENATDHKQYQSLKKEIEHLKSKQVALEESLIESWQQLEAVQKELETTQNETNVKLTELTQSIALKTQTIESLEKELAQLNAARIEKVKPVPQEWLAKYAVMRSRVSDPVVPVHQGACGACFYRITEDDLMQLRRRKLLQCKGCFRLLYSKEFEKEIEPAS